MHEIKAPYNFVPVTDKVFSPDWADKISHDIPFSDGESGHLELEIEAKSPLYIRNSTKKKSDGLQPEDFFNHQGKYYIPGSSLKGMIRNVVEIISYGKMKPVENGRYSIREFKKGSPYNLVNYAKDIRGGFLIKENGNPKIIDCGKPARISHHEIDVAFKTRFEQSFVEGGILTKKNKPKEVEDNARTAEYKYTKLFGENSLKNHFSETVKNQIGQSKVSVVSDNDGRPGTIVFTGQASVRTNGKKPTGKFYEFVFWEPDESAQKIDVPEDMLEDFFFIYKNYDENNISPDWKYWKPKYNEGERVPVFFRLDKNKLKDFGLSFMYKMPFKNSVRDLLPESHKTDISDLAECMFGPVTDQRDNPSKQRLFKGRIQFSHAKPVSEILMEEKVSTVLGTPSASFYPFYLKQPKGHDLYTYQDDDSSLAGWKRYPVHQEVHASYLGNQKGKIMSHFHPLKPGTKFIAKVAFHNLRKAEIGALLSALTFHNTDGCYHSLGMAKSLGYGKVTIAVKEKESGLKYPLEDYLKAFEELLEVNGDLKIQDWSQHKAYCELMTMASEQPGRKIPLEHMELKDFREVKNNKGWLQPYSNLPGVRKKCPGTYLTKEDRNKKFINRANELAKERLKTEEAIKKREEDLKKQQEEKIKAEEAARREKAEELKNKGLGAMLDESVADEFNKVRGRVDNYLKKVGKLNVDDIQNILYPKIKACFEKEKIKPRTLKPWQGEINQSPVWKKVSSWVGEDLARKWKQEMMGEEV